MLVVRRLHIKTGHRAVKRHTQNSKLKTKLVKTRF